MKSRKRQGQESKQQYVVYTRALGRTPMGVYRRHVVVAGDVAIVLPRSLFGVQAGWHGDLLPASNVFGQDEKAALAYLAGGEGGHPCWAVFIDPHPYKEAAKVCKLFEVFRGFMVRHTIEMHGGVRGSQRTLVRADNKAQVSGSEYSCRTFETRAEAIAFARDMKQEAVEKAKKELDAAKANWKKLRSIRIQGSVS